MGVRRIHVLWAVVVALALVGVGIDVAVVSARTPVNHYDQLDTHLREREVSLGHRVRYLADTVCSSLKAGVPAPVVADRMSKQHLLHPSDAQMLVYWSAADICPDELRAVPSGWQAT